MALTGHLEPEMEANMDERIRGLWQAQPDGSDPLRFARAVSDANFLPMIDPA